MKLSYSIELIEKLTKQNKLLFVVFIVLLGTVLVQSCSIMNLIGKERILIMPPIINKEITFSGTKLADSYLIDMATYFSSLMLNISSATYQNNSLIILSNTESSNYLELKKQLEEQFENIKEKQITTVFIPLNFKVFKDSLEVQIEGEKQLFVASNLTSREYKKYLISFTNENGTIKIKSFMEQIEKTNEKT